MKKTVLLLLCLIVIAASCKKTIKETIQDATTISKTKDYSEEVDIPYYPNVPFPPQGLRISLPPFASPTYIGDFLKELNTTTGLVRSAKATSLGLKLITPENGNLNYVDSLWIYISAKGLNEQLVAYKYPIPKGVKDIPATITDAELKDYVIKDTIFYRVEGHFTKYPDSNTKLQLYGAFKVEATPVQ